MIGQGEIIVIDDFVSLEYQEKIKQELIGLDNTFPWHYTEDITGAGDYDSQHRPAMSHQYVEFDDISPGIVVSDYHDLMIPMLKKVGFRVGIRDVKVIQGRSFLQFPIKERGEPDLPHIDIMDKNHIVGLYYVIDSDGDTIIYNERKESKTYTIKQRVTPKQGRIVIFDGGLYHTAEQPLNNTRCIINYNIE